MIAEDDGRWLYDKLDQKQRIQTVSGLRAQNRDRGGREAGAERAGPRGGWDLRMCWSDWMHVRRGLSSACVRGGCQLSSYHQPLSPSTVHVLSSLFSFLRPPSLTSANANLFTTPTHTRLATRSSTTPLFAVAFPSLPRYLLPTPTTPLLLPHHNAHVQVP